MNYGRTFLDGIIKNNPTFVLVLGICPTLAVTTEAMNGLAMGLAVIFVLTLSNILISLFKKVIPDQVRIPAFIMIIATLVTIVKLVMEAYTPSMYSVLGIFIPLIVVNCIVLGRAESFASKNGVVASMFDGLGTGCGFTLSLTCIGMIREFIGNGSIFKFQILPGSIPWSVVKLPPGGFITLGLLMALIAYKKAKKSEEVK